MEIILKKFTENDFVHYFELVNDEKVMEMITERAIALDEALDNFKDLINNNKINEYFGNFKIINTKTNDFLGLAKLEIKSEDDHETELGYMILPKYWGNGIASKVCKLLLSSAKKHKQIDKVFAIIDPQNLPSRRILINNSFTSKEFKDFDGLPGEILELKLK